MSEILNVAILQQVHGSAIHEKDEAGTIFRLQILHLLHRQLSNRAKHGLQVLLGAETLNIWLKEYGMVNNQ